MPSLIPDFATFERRLAGLPVVKHGAGEGPERSALAPGLIVVLALVKPLSPPGDLSGQLICGPIEA